MKPQELRIGNWVWIRGFFNYEKKPFRIFMIDGINDCTTFNPIPLTPDILKAAGLERSGQLNDTHYWKSDPFISFTYGNYAYGEGDRRRGPSITIGKQTIYPQYKIKYLHQLQNLYFALTGEELNIDIKPDTI